MNFAKHCQLLPQNLDASSALDSAKVGESPNFASFYEEIYRALGEGKIVVRMEKNWLVQFYSQTHGKIQSNRDFSKMSEIWTSLPPTLGGVLFASLLIAAQDCNRWKGLSAHTTPCRYNKW